MDEAREPQAAEEQPFLASEPPPLVARGLVFLVIGVVLAAAVFSVTIKLPETVTAEFVLVPRRGADPLRAPESGRVREVVAAEGARVAVGSPLFVLHSPDQADRGAEVRTAESREQSAQEGLANARGKHEIAVRTAAEEMGRLTQREAYLDRVVRLKREQLALTEEQAERIRRLNAEGLVSAIDDADARIGRAQAQVDLEQFESDLRETRNAIRKQRLTAETESAAFQEEERKLLDQLAEARIQREKASGESAGAVPGEIVIAAPCDGTLVRLAVRAAGAVVQEGETMAEVACGSEELQAEIVLPQEALARVRPGQTVKLLYDAFPYERYGVKEGTVLWTSPAAVAGAAHREFRALAELRERSVRVGGEERELLPGMKGRARIVVGRRSVISFIFAPLRQLAESAR